MKTLIFTLFLFLSTITYGQDISLPRDVAEKALKAIEIVPALQLENENLKNEISVLKASQQTPCSLAINSITKNLLNLENINTSKLTKKDAKYVRKMRDKTYKFLKNNSNNILQSQCNYKEKDKLQDFLKLVLPLSLLLLI